MFKLRHFSAIIVPWTGYGLGLTAAFACRLSFKQGKTVAIETGVQNYGVAFFIMYTNLPSPEADLSLMPLIVVSMLTNIPLFLVYFSLKIYRFPFGRFCFPSQQSRPHLEYIAGEEEEEEEDKEENFKVVEMKSIEVTSVKHQSLEDKKKEEAAVAKVSPIIEKNFNFNF